ncbi:hypothetical protein MMC07_000510 [Pseudocyphellaria aurata]|nr:hypothetical protein [Pseudocyphellaria aurata]
MEPHHRKIDLQSPADLIYLRDNIRNAAKQKLDLAIPPQGEDAFRTKVQDLVQDYITQTLTLALPSLAINGLDAPASLLAPSPDPASPSTPAENDSNYEAYDPRLAAKLRELYAQLEYESTRAAELRREAPGAAARAYIERLEAEMELEREREREQKKEWESGGESSAVQGIELECARVERPEEVKKMWQKGNEGLVGLERITEVLARLERAGKAAEVVEDM